MGNTLSIYPVGQLFQKDQAYLEGPGQSDALCKTFQTCSLKEDRINTLQRYSQTKIQDDPYLRNLASDLTTFYSKLTKQTFDQQLCVDSPPPVNFIPIPVFRYVESITVRVTYTAVFQAQSEQTESPKVPPKHPTPSTPKTVCDALILLSAIVLHSCYLLRQIEKKRKTNKKHKELANQLVSLTSELELVLMSYTYNRCSERDRPSYEGIKEKMRAVHNEVRRIKPEEWNTEVHSIFPETILCCFLGIKEEHGNPIRNIEPHWRDHQTDLYWIHRLLDNNYNSMVENNNIAEADMATTGLADPKTQFMALGFTESRSEILANWLKKDPLSHHQTVLYFAKRYVENAFEGDIFLNSSPRHPFEGSIGEVRYINVETDGRIPEEKEDCAPSEVPVKYINLDSLGTEHYCPQESDSEYRVLYHATNHYCAEHILHNGIQVSSGNQGLDFSDGSGFYMTENFKYAVQWANLRSFPSPPAVVCFKIPRVLLAKHKGLELNASKADELDLWKDIVSYNHKGQDLSTCRNPKKTKSFFTGKNKLDFLEGPVSRDGDQILEEVSQLCILTDSLGEALSDPRYIQTVLFS